MVYFQNKRRENKVHLSSLEGIDSSDMCVIVICTNADTSVQILIKETVIYSGWVKKYCLKISRDKQQNIVVINGPLTFLLASSIIV